MIRQARIAGKWRQRRKAPGAAGRITASRLSAAPGFGESGSSRPLSLPWIPRGTAATPARHYPPRP
ncbi:hypothetical protein APA63_31725 [Pseudomonas aeruginosa]|nr:hypothetical protein APA63_31725 [Pseudomonas aeruginosa]